MCQKDRFDSGVCLLKPSARPHQNSCVPFLQASVCVLRETAECEYDFPSLCEAAVAKLFRSLGHVAGKGVPRSASSGGQPQ